jgi:hypothetical protein
MEEDLNIYLQELTNMEKKNIFTKILAILGTVLVWLPILAPFLFAGMALFSRGRFLFDYLLPAEFFPVALAGAGLLLWAALKAHSQRKLIGWGLVSAVLLLVGSQGLAVVTGLASGEIEATGLWWTLTLAGIICYALALVVVGVGGLLLLRNLFRSTR